MRPRITAITIGVDDLGRSLVFYRDGLGFQTNGIMGTELILYQSANGATDCVFSTEGNVMTLQGDCTTDSTIMVPDGFMHNDIDGNQ